MRLPAHEVEIVPVLTMAQASRVESLPPAHWPTLVVTSESPSFSHLKTRMPETLPPFVNSLCTRRSPSAWTPENEPSGSTPIAFWRNQKPTLALPDSSSWRFWPK